MEDGEGRVEVGSGSAGGRSLSAETSSPTGTGGGHCAGSTSRQGRDAAKGTPHAITVGARETEGPQASTGDAGGRSPGIDGPNPWPANVLTKGDGDN